MPMPEIEHAIELMPEVLDLQKRVRELEAFARWVASITARGEVADDFAFALIAKRAILILKGD